MHDELRSRLQDAESKIRSLREEKARLNKVFESAKAAAEASESDEAINAALAGKESIAAVDAKLEAVTDEQIALLRRLGDMEAGKSGFASPGLDGWETAAQKLNLADGELRVDVQAASLLAPSLRPSPGLAPASGVASSAPAAAAPVSNRWLYPTIPNAPFGPGIGDLTTTDFVITYSAPLTGGISGTERDPDAVTQKATITPTVTLATPKVRQFAAVMKNVPSKIFDTQEACRALLGTELARRLSETFDAYVVGVIQTAAPPSGSTGSNLLEKIRRAAGAMRDNGGEPSVIALSPSDAAGLDVFTDTGGHYVFVPPSVGEASVWRLQIREVPAVTAPLLLDPRRLGTIYTGEGTVLVDPYSSMETNQVKARVEIDCVMHVRAVQQGAYRIV